MRKDSFFFFWVTIVALAAIGVWTIAYGAEVELTRTVTITDDTTTADIRQVGSEMFAELVKLGCERARLYGIAMPDKPRELHLVLTCVEWREGSPFNAKPTEK